MAGFLVLLGRFMKNFLENPSKFPHSLDLKRGVLNFVDLDQDRVRNLPFLDYRFIGPSPKLEVIALTQLYEKLWPQIQNDKKKLNFIFHSSFCCSTLLARCLDIEGKNLSLKEPMVLLGLAQYKQTVNQKIENDTKWEPLQNMILHLLGRSHDENENILVKPSNAANNLVSEILSSPYGGKFLVLYSKLERFLISILKGGQRRQETVSGLLPVFLFDHANDLPLPVQEIPFLNPLKRAALMWALQMKTFHQVFKEFKTPRLKSLESDTFLAQPEKTFYALGDFFGFEISHQEAEKITKSPAFLTHSKEQGRPYSRKVWEQTKTAVLQNSGKEIREATDFVRDFGFPVDKPLANPVLN